MSATRRWVDAFADEMESRLDSNRHKGDRAGWSRESPHWLMKCLLMECAELYGAICDADSHEYSVPGDLKAVRSEAADVANFALMVADVAGGLKLKRRA